MILAWQQITWWQNKLYFECFATCKIHGYCPSNTANLDPQLPHIEQQYFHSARVHLQLVFWKNLTHHDVQLNPEQ